jgi:Na+-transporting NADH:ubiquinone oxidoreductase subunit A
VISGSVLTGRKAMGEIHGFLGRFHLQISALREGREREFLGWLKPGFDMFSTTNAYASALTPSKRFDFTTARNGSHRHMVPIGMYERVFPFDILPTFLLRAILVKDVGRAEELGVLELDEEDVALCTFVCPGKQDYGPVLRENLETIWKEG